MIAVGHPANPVERNLHGAGHERSVATVRAHEGILYADPSMLGV